MDWMPVAGFIESGIVKMKILVDGDGGVENDLVYSNQPPLPNSANPLSSLELDRICK